MRNQAVADRWPAYCPERLSARVSLVPGSPRLLDAHLEYALTWAADSFRPQRRGAFRRFVEAAARRCAARVVLVDLSPHVGVVNRVLALACDAVLPCALADRASVDAFREMLHTVWPQWLAWLRDAVAEPARHGCRHRYRATPPRLLPAIVSRYAVTGTQGDGAAATVAPDASAQIRALEATIAAAPPVTRACYATSSAAAMWVAFAPECAALATDGVGAALRDPRMARALEPLRSRAERLAALLAAHTASA
jgi:hypothetical protein